jgi:Catalytic LigB subunit of aromatic ring-opening dioxygenase
MVTQHPRAVTDVLLEDGFDMAYSYKKREGAHFPHSILNTQVFLDYANYGAELRYPILPITVNCYGQHAIARKGGLARFADIKDEQLDPIGPSPARCYALGAAVSRAMQATGKRVAYVASSSWSHAFLNDKDWHLRPDTAADMRLYDAMIRSDYETWTAVTGKEIVDAGQHELLNWFCLIGAVHEQDLALRWSTFVETDVFNSNKAFAIFGEEE